MTVNSSTQLSTINVWGQAFYTDISGQMRRLRVRDDKFDGPLINPKTTIGKWLYHELVMKFTHLDTFRDSAMVEVSAGARETATWKLIWHVRSTGPVQPYIYHSVSNFPGPQLKKDDVTSRLYVETSLMR